MPQVEVVPAQEADRLADKVERGPQAQEHEEQTDDQRVPGEASPQDDQAHDDERDIDRIRSAVLTSCCHG